MKQKKTKPKKEKAKIIPPPLPKEVLLPGVESFMSRVPKKRWSGKLGGSVPISYSLSLPLLPHPDTNSFLEDLRDRFLFFLASQGEKQRDEVWFGGLDWYFEKDRLVLLFAFCPFRERNYRKAATLLLSPEGRILGVETTNKKPKRKAKKPKKIPEDKK